MWSWRGRGISCKERVGGGGVNDKQKKRKEEKRREKKRKKEDFAPSELSKRERE